MRIITKGSHPHLGLFSGIHGDEWQIIGSVEKTVTELESQLPDFLFIPECSPTAVAQKTRLNGEGIDLNRSFTREPTSAEARAIIRVLKQQQLSLCVDFHEDVEHPGVYLYDTEDIEGSRMLAAFRSRVAAISPLYTGLDDERDPQLGGQVYKGYRVVRPPKKDYQGNHIYEGFIDLWAMIEQKASRWITLEIPTNLTQEQKDRIVLIFFQTFILKQID